MKILFLSRWYPYPPDNGSKIRILNMLRALCQKHNVTLLSFVDPGEGARRGGCSGPGPEEIRICPYREFRPSSVSAILGYFSPKPRWIVDTHSAEMEALIRNTIKQTRFDLVIASQTGMASYYPCFDGIPAILEELELGSFYPTGTENGSAIASIRKKLRWEKHKKFIAGILPHFTLCTVTSEIERGLLAEAVPGWQSVRVIPNCIDVDSYKRYETVRVPGSLIFAGSLRYAANLDAMTWFLGNIYPIIRSGRQNVALTITGDPGSVKLPVAPKVVQTGRVQDVGALIASSAVSIAPIRIGGGTRLKILESFALRTPVVATSKAAEGLDARDGEHLLIADTPEIFAHSVLRLIEDPEKAWRTAEHAFHFVRERYDWNTLSGQFLRQIEQVARL